MTSSTRRSQCAFNRPPSIETLAKRARLDADSPRPLGQRQSLAVHGIAFRVVSVTSAIWSLCQSLLKRPAESESFIQRAGRNPGARGPLRFSQRLAAKSDASVRTFVDGLLGERCPDAVLRRVRAVVVFAFERVIGRRPPAHIRDERCEAVAPLVAHADAALPVTGKPLRLRIMAAIFSGFPYGVFGRVVETVCADSLQSKAATACRVGFLKRRRSDASLVAAVASTQPRAIASDVSVVPNRNEPTEPLTRDVDWGWHCIRLYAGFNATSPIEIVIENP